MSWRSRIPPAGSRVIGGDVQPEPRKRWSKHDPDIPKLALFILEETNSLFLTEAQMRGLTEKVSAASETFPSPQDLHAQHPVLFEAYIKWLKSWLADKDVVVRPASLIKHIRSYTHTYKGWFDWKNRTTQEPEEVKNIQAKGIEDLL